MAKVPGNIGTGPVGRFSMARGAESRLLALGWCFLPGICWSRDCCFALSAHPTCLVCATGVCPGMRFGHAGHVDDGGEREV